MRRCGNSPRRVQRALERLRTAPEEAWSKQARHAIFGPSSFLEVIGFMAEHDRLHLRQAWRTLEGRRDRPRIGISPAVL